jgi:hypothetical protein
MKRYPFCTFGLTLRQAEARLQFGAWYVSGGDGGRWTHTTVAAALADRDHLRRCGAAVGPIRRAPVRAGRVPEGGN